MLKPKVSIVGAGNVGTRYAYNLMINGLVRSIVVLDLDKQRTEGEVLDLTSGMPYISPVEIVVGDYPDLKGSDLIVITAGKKQKPAQSRLELAKENAEVFKSIIPQIMKYAKDAVLLVVTNPVDVLSYVTYKISGKPYKQVIGSGTVLDTARFRSLLSKHCNVDAHNIHTYILGEHGDSEFPVYSRAMIGGLLFRDYCPICNRCQGQENFNQIFEEVKGLAYRIIEKKGETSYGIGLALTRITRAIINDENAILPVCSLVDGYLGIHDVYLSLPAVVNKDGVREVLELQLDIGEKEKFINSAKTLQNAIKELRL